MLPEVRTTRLSPSRAAVAERCYASAFRALEQSDLTHARRLFAILALLEPAQERGWVGLGVCHERTEHLQAAAALYALGNAFTGSSSAWLSLGRARTLRALGRGGEAEAEFDRAELIADDVKVLEAIQEERCQA